MKKLLSVVTNLFVIKAINNPEKLDCIWVSHLNWYASYETDGLLGRKYSPVKLGLPT